MLRGGSPSVQGGGYDVVDMDLLDGVGDGRRSAVLEDKYGVYVQRKRGK